MKKRIYVMLVAVLVSFVAICQKVDVIPQPAVVEVSNGKGFVMNGTTTLYIDKSMKEMPAVEFLKKSFSRSFAKEMNVVVFNCLLSAKGTFNRTTIMRCVLI